MSKGRSPAARDPSAGLAPAARQALERLVELLEGDPSAPSSVTGREQAWKVHVADSLSGLAFDEVRGASSICDIGSGAGFPGLVLAVATPARVDLVESVGRKCEFIDRAIAAMTGEAAQPADRAQPSRLLGSARVVCERAETWASGEGREAYDLVTARAVGRLATLAELASPLLEEGGHLVAWKGRRDPEEEEEAARAVPRTAVEPVEVLPVGPYAGSRHRHLHLLRKAGATPAGLPRKPGLAKKRPFGHEPSGQGGGSEDAGG